MTKWRNRVGEQGTNELLKPTIEMAVRKKQESQRGHRPALQRRRLMVCNCDFFRVDDLPPQTGHLRPGQYQQDNETRSHIVDRQKVREPCPDQ